MQTHRSLPPITSLFPGIQDTPMIINIITPPVPIVVAKKTSLKSKFTAEEDKKLMELVAKTKTRNWNEIAASLGSRNARQCRERWNNYLNPSLRNDPWTEEEDKLLLDKHAEFGTHWNKISKCFSNRSDNAVRNRWQLLMRHLEKNGHVSSSSSNSSQMSDE